MRCIHDTIDIEFHQDFRVFPVHVIDVFYQLVVLLLALGLDHVDHFLLQFAYFLCDREQDAALVLASAGVIGIVITFGLIEEAVGM